MILGLNRFDRRGLLGWPLYPGGALTGPEAGASEGANGEARLTFEHVGPGCVTADQLAAVVFRRGAFAGVVDVVDGRLILPQSYDTNGYDIITMLPMQRADPLSARWADRAAFFETVAVGDRVRIRWTDRPDDDDFYAYVLYWDEGDGGDVDTELAVLTRREQCEYITASLDSGTYAFRIEYRDTWGNESDEGETSSVTLTSPPAAPAIDSSSWNATTGVLTLTFDTSDELTLWANYVRTGDQTDLIWWDCPFDFKRIGSSQWVSRKLWPGRWRILATRHLVYGVESIGVEHAFTLVESGSSLVKLAAFGNPVHARAVPEADAVISVEWSWEGDAPEGTYVEIQYRQDDGEWTPTGNSETLWLTMDDNAANATVVDSSGNGYNQTFVDLTGDPNTSAHTTAGVVGTALDFDGSDDYIDLGTTLDSLYAAGQDFTIAFWFRSFGASDWRPIASNSFSYSGTPVVGIFVGSAASPNLRFRVNTASRSALVYSVAHTHGEWVHVVLRRNNATLTGWKNGASVGSNTDPDNASSLVSAYPTRIAVRAHTLVGYFAPCQVDDVRAYDRALTADEIAALYNDGNGRATAVLETQLEDTDASAYEFQGESGSTYQFRLRAYYTDGTYSATGDWTDAVTATADGDPPDGDHDITLEAIC